MDQRYKIKLSRNILKCTFKEGSVCADRFYVALKLCPEVISKKLPIPTNFFERSKERAITTSNVQYTSGLAQFVLLEYIVDKHIRPCGSLT